MKIRNGWVGNSSSSSFIIVGYQLDRTDINDEINESLNDVYPYEEISKKCFKEKLEYERGLDEYGDNYIFIGIDPYYMEDNETKLQFKQRVCDKINRAFGSNIDVNKINLYTDCSYDG